jgi:NAD(P)-dependent dehydrogenase (short-subunit alcohol dehydrogenase family)/pimeloyl-ACP methyl ester carboxylesterase
MTNATIVKATDGLSLAVTEHSDRGRPTVLLIHGYPDEASVWDGIVAQLAPRFHVVTYDVRGSGASDQPKSRKGYRIDQLASDIRSVIDAVSPDRAVHVIAHDWGSVQAWHFVTSPGAVGRVASYNSISGPCLDHTAFWIRSKLKLSPRALRDAGYQAAHSAYVGFFLTPRLPELLWRTGLLDKVAPGGPTGSPRSKKNGLNLYRENIAARLRHPAERRTDIPVQVLAPTNDSFVGPTWQTEAPQPWVTDLYTRRVKGSHWIIKTRPELIARQCTELIDYIETDQMARGLRAAKAAASPEANMGSFVGKLVVVTGGGSGIGKATALEFARKGADVVVADINPDTAESTAAQLRDLGVEAAAYQLDVSDVDAFESFAKHVQEEHGVADVLVNNAGIGMAGPFLNLRSVITGSRVFAEQMVANRTSGKIVNIASAAAYTPSRMYPAYATTKAAVLALTECLRAEFVEHGIGVVAICPGFVNTDISKTTHYVGVSEAKEVELQRQAVKSYGRRNYSPERVAEQIVKATKDNKPIAIITIEAKVLRVAQRFTPRLIRAFARVDLNKR